MTQSCRDSPSNHPRLNKWAINVRVDHLRVAMVRDVFLFLLSLSKYLPWHFSVTFCLYFDNIHV